MTRVCIAGVGLIGGSLGQALRRARRGGRRLYHVTGFGPSASRLRLARRLGAVDDFSTSLDRAIARADVVVLAVPVSVIPGLIRRLARGLAPNAVLTDTGSVKRAVVAQAERALGRARRASFVGAHPIAGSEASGVENANPSLFRGAPVILTPGRATPTAVARVRALWQAAGARPVTLTAAAHDRWLAATSHLPHLASFALMSAALAAVDGQPARRPIVGGSFRDMTRVAASDPDLWAGIFRANRAELRRASQLFVREIASLLSASPSRLHRRLAALSAAKRSWPRP